MEKNILLTFKGCNKYIDGGSDSAEFVTDGTLYEKNGKHYLKYTEILGDDGEAFNITMKFEKNRVTLLRYGSFSTQLILECGKKHVSYYETPHGSLVVGVVADTMSIDIGESTGCIKLFYDVEINNALSSKNSVILTYEKNGGI